MNKFKAFVIVFILISFKTFACLNGETKYLKNGERAYIDFRGLVPHGHNFTISEFPKLISELEKLYKKTRDIDYLSDKGYVLIIQKKYDEALKLYLNIEKIKPNRYSTASNIGTLYELIGENQKAYDWIKRSIQINPESHSGSEWLHLKILEAKIKNYEGVNGGFLTNNSFGKEAIPKTNLSKKELRKFAQSVYFQVNERMSFIKSEDPIIALLLFELGNLAMIDGNIFDANQIYNQAKEYGYNSDLLTKRISFTNGYLFADKNKKYKTEAVYSTKVNYEKTALLIISILIALIGLYFLIKKLRT